MIFRSWTAFWLPISVLLLVAPAAANDLPLAAYKACFEKNKTELFGGDNVEGLLDTGLHLPYLTKYGQRIEPGVTPTADEITDARVKLKQLLSDKNNGAIVPESITIDGLVCTKKNRVCGQLEIQGGLFPGKYIFDVTFGKLADVAAGDCRAREVAILDPALNEATVYSLRSKLRVVYDKIADQKAKDNRSR